VPSLPEVGAKTVPSGLSAVVVNYNAGALLAGCVASLREEGIEEVVVADNASTDRSGALLAAADPSARWLPTGANLGYGAAANLGVAATGGRYVLVCNPDVVVEAGAPARLAAALDEEPGLGVVGPRITEPDGTLYPSARVFPKLVDAVGHGLLGLVAPNNRFSRRYKLLDWDHSDRQPVDWVSGACFLARRSAWDALGGFDPSYFMYLEDVDLCWRAWRAGWEVGYEPAAHVTHVQGVSTDRHPYRMIAAHHRSLWLFAWRTTGGWRRLLLPLVGVGLVFRAGVACAHRRLRGLGLERRGGRASQGG
jgi:N-acetylglucosaminyl-diphospho-decaprenol L-rhamnosyltransferase